jgi:hypothetical protein
VDGEVRPEAASCVKRCSSIAAIGGRKTELTTDE